MSGVAGFRVAIPGSMLKMIQNIKEIAGNHSDEEVYAMLNECDMDPNETAQRLLHQDTFHEVKRKRDKRKEVNKEPVDFRRKAGVQGRGGRAGREGLNSRYVTNDNGCKNVVVEKEDTFDQATEKVNLSTTKVLQDMDIKPTPLLDCSVGSITNGPTTVGKIISSHSCVTNAPSVTVNILAEEVSFIDTEKIGVDICNLAYDKSHQIMDRDQLGFSFQSISSPRVYASSSDPTLVPRVDTHATTSSGFLSDEGKLMANSYGFEVNRPVDVTKESQPSLSSSASSRPSSNYSSRSQHPNALCPNKEWKPKATHSVASQVSETTNTISLSSNPKDQPLLPSSSLASEDVALKLQEQFGDIHISSDTKRVIIPDHLQVPKSESSGLSFGTFDSNFGLDSFTNGSPCEKVSEPNSNTSQEIEEVTEEHSLSSYIMYPAESEGINLGHPHSFSAAPEKLPSVLDAAPAQEYEQTKEDAALNSGSSQCPVVQTAPSYPALGLLPQMLPYQFAPVEGAVNPNHNASTQNAFPVPNSFDPSTNYFTQFYGLTSEGDGRFSTFLPPGVASKYNGNIPIFSSQAGQTQQESGNTLFLSSSGPTSASAVMQNQQQVPLFRQPTGIHIQHFPSNFNLPYGHYICPYVVPTIHPLLSSMSFPQQPPSGGIFLPPLASVSPPLPPPKFDISQYKSVGNSGNSTHVGVPSGYGVYSMTMAAYGPNLAATNGIPTNGEDPSATQFKENNVYMATQQANSFYNLAQQGQHFAFAPAQAAHTAFSGVYRSNQAVSAAASIHPLLPTSQDMGGGLVEIPGNSQSIYHRPQHAQMNWAN